MLRKDEERQRQMEGGGGWRGVILNTNRNPFSVPG